MALDRRAGVQERDHSSPAREYEDLRASIHDRLKSACGHLRPAEFEALVDEICSFKMRWGVR